MLHTTNIRVNKKSNKKNNLNKKNNVTDSVRQDRVMIWHTILQHTHKHKCTHTMEKEEQLLVKRQTPKLRSSERRQWRAVTSAGDQGI